MKRILLFSAVFLVATLFADAVATTAKKPPSKEATPEKCLLIVSQGTVDADTICSAMNVSACGKAVSSCQWNQKDRKCRGYLISMCLAHVPHRCDAGIEPVTKFPAKVEGNVFKFRCHEATPLQVKKA